VQPDKSSQQELSDIHLLSSTGMNNGSSGKG